MVVNRLKTYRENVFPEAQPPFRGELQILGPNRFDKTIIVATQRSYDAHFENLKKQLMGAGVGNLQHIIISEDMSPAGQWAWFEQILDRIDSGDELTIDLTHGYSN